MQTRKNLREILVFLKNNPNGMFSVAELSSAVCQSNLTTTKQLQELRILKLAQMIRDGIHFHYKITQKGLDCDIDQVCGSTDAKRSYRPWTCRELEDLVMLRNKKGVEWKDIAANMCRTISACQTKYQVLKKNNFTHYGT